MVAGRLGIVLHFGPDRLVESLSLGNQCEKSPQPIAAIAPMEAEFAVPQWVFGLSTYAFAGARRLVCSYTSKGLGRLAVIDLDSGRISPLDLPYTDFSSVRAAGDRVVFRAGSATTSARFVVLDLGTGKTETLKQSTTVGDDPASHATSQASKPSSFRPRAIAPRSRCTIRRSIPDYQAPEGEKPPLLVKCHGGPTSSASSTLDLRIQYWTSRGISVLDVIYGGSSGFGREYRERLDGNWGIVDVHDCVKGARHLAGCGLVDRQR